MGQMSFERKQFEGQQGQHNVMTDQTGRNILELSAANGKLVEAHDRLVALLKQRDKEIEQLQFQIGEISRVAAEKEKADAAAIQNLNQTLAGFKEKQVSNPIQLTLPNKDRDVQDYENKMRVLETLKTQKIREIKANDAAIELLQRIEIMEISSPGHLAKRGLRDETNNLIRRVRSLANELESNQLSRQKYREQIAKLNHYERSFTTLLNTLPKPPNSDWRFADAAQAKVDSMNLTEIIDSPAMTAEGPLEACIMVEAECEELQALLKHASTHINTAKLVSSIIGVRTRTLESMRELFKLIEALILKAKVISPDDKEGTKLIAQEIIELLQACRDNDDRLKQMTKNVTNSPQVKEQRELSQSGIQQSDGKRTPLHAKNLEVTPEKGRRSPMGIVFSPQPSGVFRFVPHTSTIQSQDTPGDIESYIDKCSKYKELIRQYEDQIKQNTKWAEKLREEIEHRIAKGQKDELKIAELQSEKANILSKVQLLENKISRMEHSNHNIHIQNSTLKERSTLADEDENRKNRKLIRKVERGLVKVAEYISSTSNSSMHGQNIAEQCRTLLKRLGVMDKMVMTLLAVINERRLENPLGGLGDNERETSTPIDFGRRSNTPTAATRPDRSLSPHLPRDLFQDLQADPFFDSRSPVQPVIPVQTSPSPTNLNALTTPDDTFQDRLAENCRLAQMQFRRLIDLRKANIIMDDRVNHLLIKIRHKETPPNISVQALEGFLKTSPLEGIVSRLGLTLGRALESMTFAVETGNVLAKDLREITLDRKAALERICSIK